MIEQRLFPGSTLSKKLLRDDPINLLWHPAASCDTPNYFLSEVRLPPNLSLMHMSEPTRLGLVSYAVVWLR